MSEVDKWVQAHVELADTDMLPHGQLRASDRDRREAAQRLLRAKNDGRIDEPAYSARHQAIMEARSVSKMEAHLADLPARTARNPLPGLLARLWLMLMTVVATVSVVITVHHDFMKWIPIIVDDGYGHQYNAEGASLSGPATVLLIAIGAAGLGLLLTQVLLLLRAMDRAGKAS